MPAIKKSEACTECREVPPRVRNGHKFTLCDDCHRQNVLLRLQVRKVKRALADSMHRVVQYYADGWRAGYLLNIGLTAASIQPIGGRNGICPDVLRVSLANIKPETMCSAAMPTVEDYYAMTDKKKVPVLVVQNTRAMAAVVAGLPKAPVFVGLDLGSGADVAVVQDIATSTVCEPPNNPKTNPKSATERLSKHAPFDAAEAVRLYNDAMAAGGGELPPGAMSAIIEAVRGTRATGGTGNLVRAACRAAGVYKEPTK